MRTGMPRGIRAAGWLTLAGALLGAATGAAAQDVAPKRTELRVCQDPNNLPFSNTLGQGIENRIAEVFGKAIVSNVGPRLLYDHLIAQDDLAPEFRRRVKGYKVGSGTFRMNVALSELPRFSCLPEPGEHHQSGIILAPTLELTLDRRQPPGSNQ